MMLTAFELLAELGITYAPAGTHHHVREGWIGLDCPLCSPGSGSFKAGVTVRLNAASCWRCGGLRIVDVLVGASKQPAASVLSLLKPFWGVSHTPQERKAVRGTLEFPFNCGELNARQREYLDSRDFPMGAEFVISRWGLRGVTDRIGPWAFRIVAPSRRGDQVVSWTTRAIGGAGQRWVNAKPSQESYPAKRLLYGAEQFPGRTAIVVEGPSDAWAVGPGAIATLGLKFTTEQMRLMSEYARVLVCFDREVAARKRAADLAADLAAFVPQVEVIDLDADDPGAISKKEWVELRTYAFGGDYAEIHD